MSYPSSSSMATQSIDRGPELDNPTLFYKVEKVPIIDVLERSYLKKDKNGKVIKVRESVDEDQLETLLENSRMRAENGEFGIVFLGHTNDHGTEAEQPQILGYLNNYEIGIHNGRPTILADMYLDKEECDPSRTLKQFPRRSGEVIAIDRPNGYIDGIGLLKRTPERDLGLLTRKQNSSLVSRFHSTSSRVSRFACPACEKEQKKAMKAESKMATGDAHSKVIKGALDIVKNLSLELLRKNSEPSDSSDSSDSSDTSESSDTSDSSGAPMASRYRKMDSSDTSDASEPSEDEPSIDSSADEPSDVKKATNQKKTPKMSRRMDPSNTGPDEPSGEPSRMKKKEYHKTTKKSKMEVGSGAGYASPYTSPPSMSAEASKDAKPTVKTKSRMSHRVDEDEERMSRDSERIQVSRYQKQLDSQSKIIEQLQARLDAADSKARKAVIERKIAQLEGEGFELNRSREVARFMKMDDADHEGEIEHIRTHYRQSPVNQPMIRGLGEDVGGSTLQRPVDLRTMHDPLPEECANGGIPIIGSHVARFAKDAGIKIRKRNNDRDENVYDNMTAANMTITRMAESQKKTRIAN